MSELIPFLPPADLEVVQTMNAMDLSEIQDWGLAAAGVPEQWKKTKGAGVTVAVLDTGVANHDDLRNNMLAALNFSAESSAEDRQGHGTHVAGIIAALSNGFGVVGVAPEAKVLPIKVLDNSGRSSYDHIVRGLRAAIDAGVDIINMSLGSPTPPPAQVEQLIKEAASKNIIIVAAAGNDSGPVNYPAHYNEVIAVGAVDRQGNMAPFSSRGSEVDAVAPGVDIYSTHLHNNYATLRGTSQASPFIAGVCALLLAWSRDPASGVKPIQGVSEMLQRLDDVCQASQDSRIGRFGDYGFGMPHFSNPALTPINVPAP